MSIKKMVPGLLLASLIWIGCFALLQWHRATLDDDVAVQGEEQAPGLGKLLPMPERVVEAVILNSLG
ncbi:hypothetical protein [Sphingomonas montanisoli]|uniref:Uncharacterized protein n=1 Tax=Sphingomonas montanisoli TaxID=2606412 RepID=A0A5D9CEA4_9SPHN|nr:hypothetical protein [Sphingomonas montanisoli]TZG29532.1 hypothetical protein FYJ91_05265 [Sphingomonas montanisoli]